MVSGVQKLLNSHKLIQYSNRDLKANPQTFNALSHMSL